MTERTWDLSGISQILMYASRTRTNNNPQTFLSPQRAFNKCASSTLLSMLMPPAMTMAGGARNYMGPMWSTELPEPDP